MSKHTSGPWAVFHDHPDEEAAKSIGYIRSTCEDNGAWNAWRFSEIATMYGCEDEEQAANARLIAAAPELLKSAKSAERLAHIAEQQASLVAARARRDVAGDGRFGIAVNDDAEAKEWRELQRERATLLALIRAAIAKATNA